MSKKNKILIKGLIVTLFFVFIWIVCSAIFFLEIYSPLYVVGALRPFAYYQKHIGILLVKYGKEFDINEHEKQMSVVRFENKEHSWVFNYDNNLDFNVQKYDYGVGESITFYQKNDKQKKCEVDVRYKGRGVGAMGLPRERDLVEKKILKGDNDFLYFYAKNGQIVHVADYRNSSPQKFIGVTFISRDGKLVDLIIYNDISCSNDFAKIIFATFQFVR